MKTKFWAWLTLVLAALQILLILVSWIVSSATQQTYVHSLLSSEGIRWFMGRFSENLATPVLVWLLTVCPDRFDGLAHPCHLSRFLPHVHLACCPAQCNRKTISQQFQQGTPPHYCFHRHHPLGCLWLAECAFPLMAASV